MVDTSDLGSDVRKSVQVRVLSRAYFFIRLDPMKISKPHSMTLPDRLLPICPEGSSQMKVQDLSSLSPAHATKKCFSCKKHPGVYQILEERGLRCLSCYMKAQRDLDKQKCSSCRQINQGPWYKNPKNKMRKDLCGDCSKKEKLRLKLDFTRIMPSPERTVISFTIKTSASPHPSTSAIVINTHT